MKNSEFVKAYLALVEKMKELDEAVKNDWKYNPDRWYKKSFEERLKDLDNRCCDELKNLVELYAKYPGESFNEWVLKLYRPDLKEIVYGWHLLLQKFEFGDWAVFESKEEMVKLYIEENLMDSKVYNYLLKYVDWKTLTNEYCKDLEKHDGCMIFELSDEVLVIY